MGLSQRPIVADFEITHLPTAYSKERQRRVFGSEDIERIQPHLKVIFYCHSDRSYIYPWRNEIHLFTEPKSMKPQGIGKTRYDLSVLLHEIGHAFGLDDTYVESESEDGEDDPRVGIESSGGLSDTVGWQPFSVMAGYGYIIKAGATLITKDDVEGIRWLYRYFHEGSVDLETCYHADYEVEVVDSSKNISGCRPTHPVIFELKQHHHPVALWLIKNIDDIDLNAQDNSGNTALHYAARYGFCDVVQALSAKPDVHRPTVNDDGLTPLDYAEKAGHKRIAAVLNDEAGARCKPKPKISACAAISATEGTRAAWALLMLLLLPMVFSLRLRDSSPY